MATRVLHTKSDVLTALTTYIQQHWQAQGREQIQQFVQAFFQRAAEEDLLSKELDDWYAISIALWRLLSAEYQSDQVRVFNPEYADDGWQSTRTVVALIAVDRPFLLDSVQMALAQHGLAVHMCFHDVLAIEREGEHVTSVAVCEQTQSEATALLYFEVDKVTDSQRLQALEQDLFAVLRDVAYAVMDWRAMVQAIEQQAALLQKQGAEAKKAANFLAWLANNNFTFLGYQAFELPKRRKALEPEADSELGILRLDSYREVSNEVAILPAATESLLQQDGWLRLGKVPILSRVHRPVYLDYLGVKRLDSKGAVCGEYRFFGLYTAHAHQTYTQDIPWLAPRVTAVLARAQYMPGSHANKNITNVIETYPRDELLQLDEAQLFDTAIGIVRLYERPRIRAFIRVDAVQGFVTVLTFVPRERYTTALRRQMQGILLQAFAAEEVSFTTLLSETALARTFFVVRTQPGVVPEFDAAAIEAAIVQATRDWRDDLLDALLEQFGDESGRALAKLYQEAFPAGYRERYSPRTAVLDVEILQQVSETQPLAMSLYRPLDAELGHFQFRVFRYGQSVSLSDALPILENMGVKVLGEHPFQISAEGQASIWVHDFELHAPECVRDVLQVREQFQQTFAQVWSGKAENDGLNALVMAAGLDWRQVALLRAYTRYLRQAGFPFSQEYIAETLNQHAALAELLGQLFSTRFDPELTADRDPPLVQIRQQITEGLEQVSNLDQDRIVRRVWEVMEATLRSNFFQQTAEGEAKAYISLKFDPSKVPELPLPRPAFEIFVYSPRVEGVHLRGGKVARGGLRWSDRREDFRTEVLGLVKAQQVKNAVIVPVGAKGGFVAKQLQAQWSRQQTYDEVVACYQTFISGLLDISDNRVKGQVQPPERVVRYDEDDPYMVVAADKGTATFSDIANALAREYGFWLDDAFASGGGTGYDHKKMGITARGAWESVKRHFREMGVDTQSQPFTVVGIGDMAGDVFGNGMLLSPHIRLQAAFNHLHIFIDPDPDAAPSFAERQRLFALPGSSWEDYKAELISKGGGVFSRKAKSISLSSQVRQWLGVKDSKLTPNALINLLLKAPVDLIWNGGIGTYVKASSETHEQVGDRSNDGLRVNACELRAKVVGEGGNLGLTQLARVEYGLQGGRVNSDFVDNAGGVDCSDHEVNIKILLNEVVANGDLTEKQRNQLLAKMTDEVATLVLTNNYRQTQALSILQSQAADRMEDYIRYLHAIERRGVLDRSLEGLPSDEVLAERQAAGQGLTRPELAVLLSYCKLDVKNQLLASAVLDEPFFVGHLQQAFPAVLTKKFQRQMLQHQLRREIIATQVANEVIDEMGFTFVLRMQDETGAKAPEVVKAYMVARMAYSMPALWRQVEQLDNQVEASVQLQMLFDSSRLLRRATRWLLRNRRYIDDVAAVAKPFVAGVSWVSEHICQLLHGEEAERMQAQQQTLVEQKVSSGIADRMAAIDATYAALDIVSCAADNDARIETVAQIYFALSERLQLHWFREQVNVMPSTTHWHVLARGVFRDDLDRLLRGLTDVLLKQFTPKAGVEACLSQWEQQQTDLIQRWQDMLLELRTYRNHEPAMFSVALRELLDVLQAS